MNILALEMASQENRHCASCIGTLSFPIENDHPLIAIVMCMQEYQIISSTCNFLYCNPNIMHIGYKHIFFFHYSRLRTNLKCSFLVAQRSAREMPNSADKTLQENTVKTPMTTERKTGARNIVKYTNSLSGGLLDLDVKKTSIQSNTGHCYMAQRYSMTLTEVRRWRPRWCYYNIIYPQCVFRYHLFAHIRHCQLFFFS